MSAPPLDFSSVLVTGGAGFVGSHLVPALRARLPKDARLVIGDRHPVGSSDAEAIPLNLADEQSVQAVVREVRPDLVVHLAAQASVAASTKSAEETWRVNFGGTFALAAALAADVPDACLFFASSAEVYGRAFLNGIADESTRPAPQSAYARSKLASELMLGDVLDERATLIVARPCNHTGAGQTAAFVLASFAEQIVAAQNVVGARELRVGNLDSERDFLDVRDVVEAYLALLAAPALRGRRSTFNIASGQPRKIGALLHAMIMATDQSITVATDPARQRPSEIPVAAIDATRLRAATGWSPTISIERMLDDLLTAKRRQSST